MNLLPGPRSLKIQPGKFVLPARATLQLDASLPPDIARSVARRLQSAAGGIGVELTLLRGSRREEAPAIFGFRVLAALSRRRSGSGFGFRKSLLASAATENEEAHALTIHRRGITIEFREIGGLNAAVATLRQLLREHGRRLPCLQIRDWPDFLRRGVMLDVSRGRVPKLETLLELVEHLADFKINEFQLYTEHTFAYRKYRSVWRGGGAITAREIRKLDVRCRELGIDLVPNQNSFGHLRCFLEHPRLKKLAEVSRAYEDASGEFLRHPATLAPNHPGTIPFLRGLYDELLPNFSSRFFNVGCDETWDLGRGQSRKLCAAKGRGRVYLDFLKRIHREVSARGRRMMFWGDIILRYPNLIKELPRDMIALNWGYEANHPFARDAARFAKANIPFYVCPGTSAWMTLIGRHDNALANLRAAARAGCRHGAIGYVITDWGDGGHPQPLAVSYLPYLAGAALSWCAKTFNEAKLIPVLSRDVFHDSSQRMAQGALALGFAHRKLKHFVPNSTPLGTVIAAPPPEQRELFCRDGLSCFTRIPGKNIRAAWKAIEAQRTILSRVKSGARSGRVLARELRLAARMAVQSCRYMLWQQALAAGNKSLARQLARTSVRELRRLGREFSACWRLRNKGAPGESLGFLSWRVGDYRRGQAFRPNMAPGGMG